MVVVGWWWMVESSRLALVAQVVKRCRVVGRNHVFYHFTQWGKLWLSHGWLGVEHRRSEPLCSYSRIEYMAVSFRCLVLPFSCTVGPSLFLCSSFPSRTLNAIYILYNRSLDINTRLKICVTLRYSSTLHATTFYSLPSHYRTNARKTAL